MVAILALSGAESILIGIFAISVLVFIALALFVIGSYNRLVQLRNRFKNAFSQIDVQLKRRYDLIPNLVETVRGYMKHESETLEAVIKARGAAANAGAAAAANPGEATAMRGLSTAESQLNGALGRLFAVVESYPDLKANQNMLSLQEELGSTENKIAFARQAYNDAVMQYNTVRETFPTVVVANFLNFTEAKLFEVETDKEREAPRVSFA